MNLALNAGLRFPQNPQFGSIICQLSFPHQRLSFKLGALAAARAQYLSIQGKAKLDTLGRAIRGSEQDFPVKALLQPPLEIYWCP